MNKKAKYQIFALVFIGIILTGINIIIQSGGLASILFKEPVFQEFELGRAMDELLTPEEMKEDLLQLKKDLEEVHPKTKDGLSDEMERAFEEAMEIIKEPMTVSDFTIIASELACLMEDAHTSVFGFYDMDPSLPMTIKVIEDEFYILEGKDLELGDKLISIGGIPIEEIYNISQKRIPSENIYWTNYNFERYVLRQSTLTQMKAEIKDDIVEVVVNRNGEDISVPLKFGDIQFTPIGIDEEYRRYKTYPEDNAYDSQFSYYLDMDNNLCHFILKSCNNTSEYKAFLEMMFEDMKKNSIENIVVDLRGNPGGDSSVVNEFLKYIDVDKYVSFGGHRRLSKQASDQRGFIKTKGELNNKPGLVKNKRVEGNLFKGDIYALIDNGTFSSGNWFGIVLADSGIGTIVGEPSGNAPSSYGDVLSFQLKNSKLIYSISYTQWIRPDEESRYDDALYPDYEVKYTIDDYINNRDLAMEKVIELIKSLEK